MTPPGRERRWLLSSPSRKTVKIHLWGIATINAAMWVVLLFMLLAGCLIGVIGHTRRQSQRRRS